MSVTEESVVNLGFWAPTLKDLAPFDFECFVRWMEPTWTLPLHQQKYCGILQEMSEGTGKREILCGPPQHGKTDFVSIKYPAYKLGRDHMHRIMLCTYGADHSEGFGGSIQELIQSPRYLEIFPDVRLARRSRSQGEWRLQERAQSHHPSFIGRGIGGGITGKGVDTLILDDVIENAQKAYSEAEKENLRRWYITTARSRIHKNTNIVIMFTRWLEDDLIGYLLAQKPTEGVPPWRYTNFPALAVENDPLGREVDEPLWPEQHPWSELNEVRINNPFEFSALWQGMPTNAAGNKIQEKWFGTYTELPDEFTAVCLSYDTANTEKTWNDQTACVAAGLAKNGYIYVFDVWAEHIEMADTEQAAKLQGDEYITTYGMMAFKGHVIEAKSNGLDLANYLRRNTLHPVHTTSPTTDKMARLMVHQSFVKSGRVLLPSERSFPGAARWKPKFLHQVTHFPGVDKDDIVDAFTQSLLFLRSMRADMGGVAVQVLGGK